MNRGHEMREGTKLVEMELYKHKVSEVRERFAESGCTNMTTVNHVIKYIASTQRWHGDEKMGKLSEEDSSQPRSGALALVSTRSLEREGCS